jgi:outer membrane immunogenic protein
MKSFTCRMVALAALVGMAAATPAAANGARGPAPASYPPIWQGLYGGVNVGALDIDDDNDFVAGVQVGYNWQFQQFVYGLEGDVSFAGGDLDWMATLRGRAGYLIDPRLLVYATAGVGYVGANDDSESDFVYGLGLEGRINSITTVRVEYLTFSDLDINVIRAGLNVKLDHWWPMR